MSGVDVVCADVFEADLPLGEARLVYADPPYTQTDLHGYGVAPDPEQLVRRMLSLGAEDAAYVLHTGAPSLATLLPVIERLAPARPRSFPGQPRGRVLAWVKPWAATRWKPTTSFQYQWEPVIVFYGKAYRHPRGRAETDWICALRNERSLGHHPTQKPDEVLTWLFERALADAEGRLAFDLFAGTGGAAIMAARDYGLDATAVDRDAGFCARIVDRACLGRPAAQPPGQLTVAVSVNGRPVWPTLGHAEPELWRDLLPLRTEVHAS